MLGQPSVAGDATRPASSRPVADQPQTSANGGQRTSIDHAINSAHTIQQERSGKKLKTRATESESAKPSRQRGLLGLPGHLWHSPGELGLCVCHLVPRLERGGRRTTASRESRHWTLPRPPGGLAAKPQQSSTIRTTRPYRAALRDRHPKGLSYLSRTRRADRSWGLPERSGQRVIASVEAGVRACGRGHLPKSPGEIRSYSSLGRAVRPLSRGFRAAGGAEQRVT